MVHEVRVEWHANEVICALEVRSTAIKLLHSAPVTHTPYLQTVGRFQNISGSESLLVSPAACVRSCVLSSHVQFVPCHIFPSTHVLLFTRHSVHCFVMLYFVRSFSHTRSSVPPSVIAGRPNPCSPINGHADFAEVISMHHSGYLRKEPFPVNDGADRPDGCRAKRS